MSNNQHKTSLAERFSEYGSTPSDAVWNAIDTQLTAQKSKNKGLIFWVSANAAMICLVIFTFTMNGERDYLDSNHTALTIKSSTKELSTSAPVSEKEQIPSSERTESALTEVDLMEDHARFTHTFGFKPFNSTTPRTDKSLSENQVGFITENQVPKNQSVPAANKISPLQTIELTSLLTDYERSLLVCSVVPTKRFRTFEFGARVSTFSEIIESDQTITTPSNDPSQMGSSWFTPDPGGYAHNYGHQRQFELEVFSRGHFRRLYYTIGLSVAKTKVEELHGNSDSGIREFITKDIMSFGAPISVGFNLIDRPRFQFALATRIIPEYSFLKNYENQMDGPVFVTTEFPEPLITTPQEGEITSAVTLGLEPHLSMNFKLNERLDVFGQFGYRTGLIRSSLFSNYFTPNFTAFSVGTIVRL